MVVVLEVLGDPEEGELVVAGPGLVADPVADPVGRVLGVPVSHAAMVEARATAARPTMRVRAWRAG